MTDSSLQDSSGGGEEQIYALLFSECDSNNTGWVTVDALVNYIAQMLTGATHVRDDEEVYDSDESVSLYVCIHTYMYIYVCFKIFYPSMCVYVSSYLSIHSSIHLSICLSNRCPLINILKYSLFSHFVREANEILYPQRAAVS